MGFAGLIDDLRISSGIRYEDDFDVPPHPLDSDDTTLALLHFDEGSGVAIVDESDPGAPSVNYRIGVYDGLPFYTNEPGAYLVDDAQTRRTAQ